MPNRPVPLFKAVIYAIVSGFLALGLGIGLAFYFIVKSSADSRKATCAVVEHSRAEKRAQLQAYDETPPTTEAGRNLRETTASSLAAWDGLWGTLGCKDAEEVGHGG
jgi:hypothetical protein